MRNFVFHNPTKVLFGRDTIQQSGNEAAQLGSRILLVYGRRSCKATGIHRQVTLALAEAGCRIFELPGVQPNPILSLVRKGIDLARHHAVDTVVAVGGGSVMDSAKAIAAGALVNHDVWQFFRGKKAIRDTLPLLTIPTLAASGSETNGGMVLTNEETQEKFGTGNNLLRPKVAILDPTTTLSVPANHTAYGAADALAHLLEFYCTAADPDTPVQDRLMEGLAENIIHSANRVLRDLHDYAGRAELMWCASLALNGLTSAGLGRVGFPMHLIEHSLSALYDVPHGAGLAVVMPAWLAWRAQKRPEKMATFSRRVLGIKEEDANRCAEAGILALQQWLRSMGCPTTMEQLQIPASGLDQIAENTKGLARIWRLPEYTPTLVRAILERAVS